MAGPTSQGTIHCDDQWTLPLITYALLATTSRLRKDEAFTGDLLSIRVSLEQELTGLRDILTGLQVRLSNEPRDVNHSSQHFQLLQGCRWLVCVIMGQLCVPTPRKKQIWVDILALCKAYKIVASSGLPWTSRPLPDIMDLLQHCVYLPDPMRRLSDLSCTIPPQHVCWKVQFNALKRPDFPCSCLVDEYLSHISLLQSPELNIEPGAFFEERARVADFKRKVPGFSKAAITLPLFADRYWNIPPVNAGLQSLFIGLPSYNFIQWAVEYARSSFEENSMSQETKRERIVELTDSLCCGSCTPLHVAAALGLTSLTCSILSASTEQVNHGGAFGSPLFCALVGPHVLHNGVKMPAAWRSICRPCERPDQLGAMVIKLLNAGAKANFKYSSHRFSAISLAGLAFWSSLATGDARIFDNVINSGCSLDEAFIDLLGQPFVPQRGRSSPKTFAVLLLRALDEALCPQKSNHRQKIQDTISKVIDYSGLKVQSIFQAAGPGARRVTSIRDVDFMPCVQDAIDTADWPDPIVLMRLTLDPRFNPNVPLPAVEDGTLLHQAVSNDHVELAKFLLDQGADLGTTDNRERTPLMVTESPEMLELLVKEYSDATTHVDVDGRNIWHFAAASNDTALLTWLSHNDPCKSYNLSVQTTAGNTPLAEAFLPLLEQNMASSPVTAAAAHLILREPLQRECFASSYPLPLVAASWGDMRLVDSLAKFGVDFTVRDAAGMGVLELACPFRAPHLFERLRQLCP